MILYMAQQKEISFRALDMPKQLKYSANLQTPFAVEPQGRRNRAVKQQDV
jgi:hypothetical protein